MDQPIACKLPPADLRARGDDMSEIARRALRSRDPLEGGARLTFAGDATTERDLRDLVAAEAQCCAFLTFDLRREDDALRLDVTGPEEAQPLIAQMFA
jgi:hypothetical protein